MNKHTLGWREWVELPELAIGPIKAKVDTGARTSALHAVDVDVFDRDGSTWVSFAYEHEDGSVGSVNEAPVLEFREVTNSGGQSESRPVIQTPLKHGSLGRFSRVMHAPSPSICAAISSLFESSRLKP